MARVQYDYLGRVARSSAGAPSLRSKGGGHIRESFATGVALGFRYVRNHRRVIALLAIAAVFWCCGAAIRTVIPAIIKNVYEGNFTQMAWFPAWIGLGLAVGAVIMATVGDAVRSDHAIACSMIGISLAMLTLAFTIFLDVHPDTIEFPD